jgi:hypothetical protein
MTKPSVFVASLVVLLVMSIPASAQVERIWLTHRTNNPSKLVVSWTTRTPGDSMVRYGPSKDYGQKVYASGNTTLHHIEIPLAEKDAKVHYAVSTGNQVSGDAVINGYPTEVLRVAVIADGYRKPNLQALMKDKIHLLMTAGDNIPDLYHRCGIGTKDCTKPYEALIDAYPEMFRSIPFMPALGNHDHQIRPRGDKPPAEAVYDIEATAFCKFFHLPDEKWKWHFDVPAFEVRFVALDLNHIDDRGTTWQSCHNFKKGSEQFRWYEKLTAKRPEGFFIVTLHNEHNLTMRDQEEGAWGKTFRKGHLVISGCGYYAERDEVNGMTYLNTALTEPLHNAKPKVKFHANEPSYVLMTFHKGKATMTVELKNLDGVMLDRTTIAKRK